MRSPHTLLELLLYSNKFSLLLKPFWVRFYLICNWSHPISSYLRLLIKYPFHDQDACVLLHHHSYIFLNFIHIHHLPAREFLKRILPHFWFYVLYCWSSFLIGRFLKTVSPIWVFSNETFSKNDWLMLKLMQWWTIRYTSLPVVPCAAPCALPIQRWVLACRQLIIACIHIYCLCNAMGGSRIGPREKLSWMCLSESLLTPY